MAAPNGQVHPAADLFPLLEGEELQALADDIATKGLLQPLTLLPDGTLLDGRNRTAACELAGITPRYETYNGDDPIGVVVSLNVKRRHLTTGQKAFIALEVEPLYAAEARERQGARTDLGTNLGMDPYQGSEHDRKAATRAAWVADTTHDAVHKAKRLAKAAQPTPDKPVPEPVQTKAAELIERVRAGTIALDAADQELKRTARQAVKAERVAVIEATTADQLDTLGTYDILYVDPPWRYDAVETPDMRAIENHYPTMTLDALKALTPPANPNAVLFMWATSPKLTEALELVDAWGFTYRTCAVWVKHAIGMGYYFRQRHELLLVAKRGNLPTPDPADRPDSIIEADRGAHSAKPDQAYELLERMYPDRTKVEMFARQRRPGWAAWGNQA